MPRRTAAAAATFPPRGVLWLSGLQHAGLVSICLLVAALACREAGLPPEKIIAVLSLSMLLMAIGPILPPERVLNLVFRIGVRHKQMLVVGAVAFDRQRVHGFMEAQGSARTHGPAPEQPGDHGIARRSA